MNGSVLWIESSPTAAACSSSQPSRGSETLLVVVVIAQSLQLVVGARPAGSQLELANIRRQLLWLSSAWSEEVSNYVVLIFNPLSGSIQEEAEIQIQIERKRSKMERYIASNSENLNKEKKDGRK